MRGRDWCVMRQDDNGDRFVVAAALTEPEARLLTVSYEVRAHNQLYWVEPMEAPRPPAPVPRP
jgi:hypothetical protein